MIDVNDVVMLLWGPCYALSKQELEGLGDWLKKMLETGKIQWTKSPAGSPILIFPKVHGTGLRLCIDYRAINKIIVVYRYPLPIMSKLQD
jgi:hypothetical protein